MCTYCADAKSSDPVLAEVGCRRAVSLPFFSPNTVIGAVESRCAVNAGFCIQ